MKTIEVDGKVVHIVRSHNELEKLQRTNSEGNIQWHFHGTPEHVEILRKAHEVHSSRASELRARHPDIHTEMDTVRDQLDNIARELDKVTTRPVELEANFNKFGYHANIRTHEPSLHSKEECDEEKDGEAGASSGDPMKQGCRERRKKTTTMKLFKKPVLRQYWHNGIIYRAKDAEEVASCELFVDLVYVGIIAFNGDKATEDPTATGLLRFCITMIPSWRIWTDIGMLVSTYETDDALQRLAILFVLACLVGYTINIVNAFDTTYAQLIAFYMAARITTNVILAGYMYCLPQIRLITGLTICSIFIPIALWIGSIFVHGGKQESLIWMAIFWDLFGSTFIMVVIRGSRAISESLHQRISNLFAFYPAINIEHRTERTGAFVSLVFGYSVVSLLYQNRATFGMNAFFGKAILGLIQAYAFNTMYFDVDGSYHHLHAIRRHALSASIWVTAHLPFIMGFTISGAALSRIVVAHDCPNANPESLTETYQANSEADLLYGWRWFYCAGLAVSLLCMAAISASHVHQPRPTQRLPKRYRLAFRVAVATVWLCLPVATSLNSLELIATTSGLTILALFVDIWGMSCRLDTWWGGCKECEYTCNSGSISRTSSRAQTLVDGQNGEAAQDTALYNFLCRQ